MKPEQLISHFLVINKTISLEGIGMLRLNKDIPSLDDPNADIIFPEESIQFEYNKHGKTDSAFIDFVSAKTGKIKSLTASDIESYLLVGKQFLNIGKQMVLKDIGVLQKNQAGIYEFIQGESTPEAIDTNHNKSTEKKEIDFSSPVKTKPFNLPDKKMIVFIAIAIALLVTLMIYFNHSKNTSIGNSNSDSLLNTQTNIPIDSSSLNKNIDSFSLVIYEFNNNISADSMLKKIETDKTIVKLISIDSAHYQIIIPFNLPLKDTAAIKDSMERKFNKTMKVAY